LGKTQKKPLKTGAFSKAVLAKETMRSNRNSIELGAEGADYLANETMRSNRNPPRGLTKRPEAIDFPSPV
jgi:hypothetical protein